MVSLKLTTMLLPVPRNAYSLLSHPTLTLTGGTFRVQHGHTWSTKMSSRSATWFIALCLKRLFSACFE